MSSETATTDMGLSVARRGGDDMARGAASGGGRSGAGTAAEAMLVGPGVSDGGSEAGTAATHGAFASTVAAPNGAAHGEPAANAGVGAPDASAALRPLDLLHKVEMAVTVELGRTRILVRDLLGLRVGSIIELDRPVGGPVDVMVNGTLLARGEVVVVDDELGVRITEVVSSSGDR